MANVVIKPEPILVSSSNTVGLYDYDTFSMGGSSSNNVIFEDQFNRGTLGTDWTLTNLGSANGVTFDMPGTAARWNCAHTATSVQPARENNITTVQTFTEGTVVVICQLSYTDTTTILAQYEVAIWWDNDNRFYFGNESATNQMFFRTREGGSVNHNYISATATLNSTYKIIWDRVAETLAFYYWNGSAWVSVATALDVSGVVTGGADPVISLAASDRNTRNGGDTGTFDYVYVLNQDISTLTP